MELRPYQKEAVKAIFNDFKEFNKTLLVLPTGTGKTVVFGTVAKICAEHDRRVLILAHRGELLEQAQDKIYSLSGLNCALEKAESSAVGASEKITVGSVQTLCRDARLEQYPADVFSLIIVDEAHHALSDSYRKIIDYFDKAKVLGVTATPDRGDMKNLGQVFENLAYEYSMIDAVKDGYLCPIQAATIPLNIDLSDVEIQNGDYKASDVGHALEPYLEQIADEMTHYCKDRKTVVFLPLIDISQKFRDILLEKGFRAAEVNGASKDREQILKDFDEGKYNVLCNSMLLTEGWDCPSVDCVVPLRPTKVRSLYCQMVGRGTRLCEGKENLLLLDFLWHTARHSLIRPAHLICKDEEVIQKMTQNLAELEGDAQNIEDAMEIAEFDVKEERKEALIEQLRRQKNKKRKLIDPLEFECAVDVDLTNYVPTFAWQSETATEKQIQTIENFGMSAEGLMKGQANVLIERLISRSKSNLATPKQIRYLQQKGFQNVAEWTKKDAGKMISMCVKNRHMVPPWIEPGTYRPKGEARGTK